MEDVRRVQLGYRKRNSWKIQKRVSVENVHENLRAGLESWKEKWKRFN